MHTNGTKVSELVKHLEINSIAMSGKERNAAHHRVRVHGAEYAHMNHEELRNTRYGR